MKNLKTRNSSCFDFDVRGESRKQTFCKAMLGLFISSKVFLMNTNDFRTIRLFANSIVRIPVVIANNNKLLIISNYIHQVTRFIIPFHSANQQINKVVQDSWGDCNNNEPIYTNSNIGHIIIFENTDCKQRKTDNHPRKISFQRMIKNTLYPFHSTNIQKIIYGINIANS